MKNLTLVSLRELEYLNWFICESLRMMPPASASTTYRLTKDVSLGGVQMQKGDKFHFSFIGLGNHGE